MVDMAVREQHLVDRHVLARDLALDHVEIAAGIDDGGAPGRLANEQRAVLLKRGNGDQGDFHVTVRRCKSSIVPAADSCRRQAGRPMDNAHFYIHSENE